MDNCAAVLVSPPTYPLTTVVNAVLLLVHWLCFCCCRNSVIVAPIDFWGLCQVLVFASAQLDQHLCYSCIGKYPLRLATKKKKVSR